MTRKISTFVLLGLIVTVIVWMLDKESVATINWRDFDVALSVPELLLLLLFAVVVLDVANRLFRALLKLQVKEVYKTSLLSNRDGQEDETILSFNSLDQSLPSGLDKSGDKYTYRDQLNLQPNTVYEYDVKASCDVHLDDGTIIEDAPGASVTRSGFLLSPPAEFVTDVSYTTKDMFITISQPLGFSSDKHCFRKLSSSDMCTTGNAFGEWNIDISN